MEIATPPGIDVSSLRKHPRDALLHTRVMVRPAEVIGPGKKKNETVKRNHTDSTVYKGLIGEVIGVLPAKEELVLKMENGKTVNLPIKAITSM